MGRDLQEKEEKIILPITAPTFQPTGYGTTELSPSSSSFIGNSSNESLQDDDDVSVTNEFSGEQQNDDDDGDEDDDDLPAASPPLTNAQTVQVGGFTLPPTSNAV